MSISIPMTSIGVTIVMTGLIAGYPLTAMSVTPRQQRIVDLVAANMIKKVNSTSCENLQVSMKGSGSAGQSDKKDAARQSFVALLKENPSLKTYFFQQVSAPLLTKMFDCGMIPPGG